MESTIFHHVERVRRSTLKLAEGLDGAMLDVRPAGFNNTIRWNLGHILTVQEGLLFGRANEPMNTPEHYRELFGNGTKPADWTVEPPTLAELIAHPDRVYSRQHLLDVAHEDLRATNDRTVDSHIKNIRRKIAARLPGVDCLQSVYGVGYRFEMP